MNYFTNQNSICRDGCSVFLSSREVSLTIVSECGALCGYAVYETVIKHRPCVAQDAFKDEPVTLVNCFQSLPRLAIVAFAPYPVQYEVDSAISAARLEV